MSQAHKFTSAAILEIRALHAQRCLDVRAWANVYNVSLETIRRIARGDTYKELPGERPRQGPSAPPTHRQLVGVTVAPQGRPLQGPSAQPTLPSLPTNQVIPPHSPVGMAFDDEPDADALVASLARVQALVAKPDAAPHAAANALIDEMIAKVRHPTGEADPPAGELLD